MITQIDVIKIYSQTFIRSWLDTLLGIRAFHLGDTCYEPANYEKIMEVVKSDEIDKMVYEMEGFDCDDFAFALMGAFHRNKETSRMAIFLTWVMMPEGGHAVISFVNENGQVGIIEPQNDAIYAPPKNWRLLLLCG